MNTLENIITEQTTVSPIKLDRLTFTCSILPEHLAKADKRRKRVLSGKTKRFQWIKETTSIGALIIPGEQDHTLYEYGMTIESASLGCLCIHMRDPIIGEMSLRRQLRCDFNPKWLEGDAAEYKRVMKLIRYLCVMPRDVPFCANMKISRLDFAVDVKGLHLSSFYMRAASAVCSKVYCSKTSGVPTGIKIGARRSSKVVTAYNRPAENNKHDPDYVDSKFDAETRFEIKLRGRYFKGMFVPGVVTSPSDIVAFLLGKPSDPFEQIKLYAADTDWKASNSDLFTGKFRARVKRYGLQEACRRGNSSDSVVSRNSKDKLRYWLKKHELTPFGDSLVWNEAALTAALSVLNPLFD